MDALEQYVEKVKLSPKVKEELLDAGKARARAAVARVKARNAAGVALVGKPIWGTVVAAAGGAAAEEVRRNIVGRVTKDCRSQGLGLILVGGAVNWLGKSIAFVPQVGQAHAAVGGAVLAASFHGSSDKQDPVAAAYEMTTYKYKHPSKEEKK